MTSTVKKPMTWPYKLYSFLSGLVFYAPAIILIYFNKGLDYKDFFFLHMLIPLVIFFLTKPITKLTSTIGYKQAFLTSILLILLYRVKLLNATDVQDFAVENLIHALSLCFLTASSSGYMASLVGENHVRDLSADAGLFRTLGFFVAVIVFGLVGDQLGLRRLMEITIIFTIVSAVVFLLSPRGKNPVPEESPVPIHLSWLFTKFDRRFFLMAFLSSLLGFASVLIQYLYIVKIFEMGFSVGTVAIVLVIYSAIQLLVPFILSFINSKKGKPVTVILLLVSAGLAFIIHWITKNWILVIMVFLPLLIQILSVIISIEQSRYIWTSDLSVTDEEAFSYSLLAKELFEILFLFFTGIFASFHVLFPFTFLGILLVLGGLFLGIEKRRKAV